MFSGKDLTGLSISLSLNLSNFSRAYIGCLIMISYKRDLCYMGEEHTHNMDTLTIYLLPVMCHCLLIFDELSQQASAR